MKENKEKEVTAKKSNGNQVVNFEPFLLVKHNDGVIIVFGDVRISPKIFESFVEAKTYIRLKPYELIINAACYCMEQQLKKNDYEKENKENAEKIRQRNC